MKVSGRRIAAGAVLLVAVLVAVTILTTVSDPRRQPLSDSASCSQWTAATPAQQLGYAHLYIDEYARFANTTAKALAVKASIDHACTSAAYLGEADDVSVLAALRRAF